jgi:hypothetical protein
VHNLNVDPAILKQKIDEATSQRSHCLPLGGDNKCVLGLLDVTATTLLAVSITGSLSDSAARLKTFHGEHRPGVYCQMSFICLLDFSLEIDLTHSWFICDAWLRESSRQDKCVQNGTHCAADGLLLVTFLRGSLPECFLIYIIISWMGNLDGV